MYNLTYSESKENIFYKHFICANHNEILNRLKEYINRCNENELVIKTMELCLESMLSDIAFNAYKMALENKKPINIEI